jgi:hypothetical protein
MESEFPSNTQRRVKRVAPPSKEELEVKQIVQGSVRRRKRSMSKRFFEMYGGGDFRSTAGTVILDILVPAAKDTVVDGFTMLIEGMIFGDAAPRGRGSSRRGNVFRQGNVGHTPYHDPRQMRRPEPRGMTPRGRGNFNFEEILLDTRVEADAILDEMFDMLKEYESVTVANLYGMLGIDARFTEHKYGWYDLSSAQVRRARGGGYLLDLPKPEPLD